MHMAKRVMKKDRYACIDLESRGVVPRRVVVHSHVYFVLSCWTNAKGTWELSEGVAKAGHLREKERVQIRLP